MRRKLIALPLAVFFVVGIFLFMQPDRSCIREDKVTARGNSLSGVLRENSQVTVLYGYYRCNVPRKGDIVAYNYTGNPVPLIKIIKAVPGDSFELKDGRIIVNGKVVTNSAGIPYALDERAQGLLSLYVIDYKKKIPADAYLLLGNLPEGSVDSTHFGLVDRKDVVGKVMP